MKIHLGSHPQLAISLACMALAAPVVHAQSAARNLDLEQGEVGQLPVGWFSPAPGYKVQITGGNALQGEKCALIASLTDPKRAPFGNLMQTFDAQPYRGKLVRLRAAVRTRPAGPGDRAQLWLRVDRPQRQMGFFDNMGDRPITAAEWQHYEIVGPVAEDALTINLGLMLIGKGRAWLDDVTFETLEDQDQLFEPPRPLQGRALENLVAYARLLGYVRYFHPSDAVAGADWNQFAIRGVPVVESADSAAALADALEALFRPLAPTVRVYPTAHPPEVHAALQPPAGDDALQITTWEHRGVGLRQGPNTIYSSRRISATVSDGVRPQGYPDPAQPFVAELPGGVSCMVPLALYRDAHSTVPYMPLGREPAAAYPSGQDRGTRLADVILAWNIFQHFYPYFDVVDVDWPASLRRSLSKAATDAGECEFLATLRLLVADLQDGHGNVTHHCDTNLFVPPVVWDWVEGQVVVTHVDAAVGDALEPGDVVLTIDDEAAADRLRDCERFISGALQWRRYKGLRQLAAGAKDQPVVLQVRGQAGAMRTVTLTRSVSLHSVSELRPPKIHKLEPGIMYVDLDRISDQDFSQALGQLRKAKGIVFDMRGYPRCSTMAIAHLIDGPVTSAQWHIPKVRFPDRREVDFQFSNWKVQPQRPRLKAKVAFVTDGRAISYAETYMGIIEHYKLGEIVGGPTAGTNGNVNPFTLPGGYHISWTGMRVLKHDGTQHHAVGILPTVPQQRTIAGIAAGRDELLEKAVEIVSSE